MKSITKNKTSKFYLSKIKLVNFINQKYKKIFCHSIIIKLII
jgi:hypothetical protein